MDKFLFPSVFTNLCSRSVNPDYINTRIEEHSWYVEQMDRETANSRLKDFPSGAFLVRCGRLGTVSHTVRICNLYVHFLNFYFTNVSKLGT